MSQPQSTAVPPQQIMMNYLLGIPICYMIGAAAQIGIPSLLADGARTAEQVAQVTGTAAEATYRLMRALSALGILSEDGERRFALTAIGQCLLPGTPGSFDALAKMNIVPWMARAHGEILHALKTGQSAFSKAHGKSLFVWLSEHPSEQELFGDAMSTFSGMEAELVLAAYDFSRARHIVDVGGGHGLLLSRILAGAPAVRGTLFDRPEVAERAKSSFIDAGLRARCDVVGGDFFEQTPPGGDLYLLKHILHDWDDARAVELLTSVASVMRPGARLLVIEQGIAPPGVPNPGKIMDVIMLMLVEGGRERTAGQHAALFEQAGLRFEREITTPGPIRLFEGVRD